MRKSLMLLGCCALLVNCGGGSSSGGGVGNMPAPTPSPSPTPTPTPTPAPAAKLTYLYAFGSKRPDGDQPNGPMIQASDGNFYGTTAAGGPNSCRPGDAIPCGVIFKITPDGQESVLYAFGSVPNDGYTPYGALIQGSDGALYGTTTNGGAFGGGGTVFRVTLAGQYTILYSFGATATDGVVPNGLIQGKDGNFYGTTASGGANHCTQIPQAGGNCGTVFKVTPNGAETVLYSFGAFASDGVEPGGLIQGADGNFYGTTQNGGANSCSSSGETHDCGTLFKVTPAGVETVLHSFGSGQNAGFLGQDGIAPTGTLALASDGSIYGATSSGGEGRCGGLFGCGTIFRFTTAGTLAIVYAFSVNSRADGDGPSGLTIGPDDNLYGTTTSGGAFSCDSCGTAFRLTPSGTLNTLYSFGPVNQAPNAPIGGLVRGKDGAFYGITRSGVAGSTGSGTVFKLTLQ